MNCQALVAEGCSQAWEGLGSSVVRVKSAKRLRVKGYEGGFVFRGLRGEGERQPKGRRYVTEERQKQVLGRRKMPGSPRKERGMGRRSADEEKRGSSLAEDARRWGGGPPSANPSYVGASRRASLY